MLSEGPDNANKRIKMDIFQSTFSLGNGRLGSLDNQQIAC
jgi:hypothetical protein